MVQISGISPLSYLDNTPELNSATIESDFASSCTPLPTVLSAAFERKKTLELENRVSSNPNSYTNSESLKVKEICWDKLNKFALSPLLLAITTKDQKLVEKLLKAGFDPKLKTTEGLDALSLAILYADDESLPRLVLSYYPLENLVEIKTGVSSALLLAKIVFPELYEEITTQLIEKGLILDAQALQSFDTHIDSLLFSKMLPMLWSLSGNYKVGDKTELLDGNFSEVSLHYFLKSIEAFKEYINRLQQGKDLLSEEENMFQEDAFELEDQAQIFGEVFNQENVDELFNLEWDVESLLQKIKSGKPGLIFYTWPGHILTVMFAKVNGRLLLIKANKGDRDHNTPTFSVHLVGQTSPQALTKVLRTLKKNDENRAKAVSYLYKEIDKELKTEPFFKLDLKDQVIGNCSWESPKLASFCLLLVKALEENLSTFSSEWAEDSISYKEELLPILERSISLSRSVHKKWWAFSRVWGVKRYLETLPKEKRDYRILYNIWKKVHLKDQEASYQKYVKNGVKALFNDHHLDMRAFYLQGRLEEAIELDLYEEVKLLIEQGANPLWFSGENGLNLISFACKKGHLDSLKQMLKTPEHLNSETLSEQDNLLLLAFKNNHMHIVDYLLDLKESREQAHLLSEETTGVDSDPLNAPHPVIQG